MKKELTIEQLIRLLVSKLWIIIIFTAAASTASYYYVKNFVPLMYTSSITMYVRNTKSPDKNDYIAAGDLSAAQSLAATYMTILQDDLVVNKLGKMLTEHYGEDRIKQVFAMPYGEVSKTQLKSSIHMNAINNTEVFSIAAQTKDAVISAAICNYYEEIAPDILERMVGAGSVAVVGSAEVANAPSSPDVKRYIILGAVLGFSAACLLIIILYITDNTLKNPEQIRNTYSIPLLGTIDKGIKTGRIRSSDKKRKDNNTGSLSLLNSDNYSFSIIESFKTIRTNIIFSLAASQKHSFVISSANPQEGKSTTAANLAVTLAQTDAKVLLIDADLRKPSIHTQLNIINNDGLTNILSKLSTLDKCIKTVKSKRGGTYFSFSVLTSGPIPPNPSELLCSERMQQLLSEASEQYDYILIDSPPLNVVTDATCVAKFTAGIVLIGNYGHTKFNEFEKAIHNLTVPDIHILGFILNNIDRSAQTGSESKGLYGKYGYADTKGKTQKIKVKSRNK